MKSTFLFCLLISLALSNSVIRTKRQCLCPQQTQACSCSNQYYPQYQQPLYQTYQTPQYLPVQSYQAQQYNCQPACQTACTQNCSPQYSNQCQYSCQTSCQQACTPAVQNNCAPNCVNQPQTVQPLPYQPMTTTQAPFIGPQNPQEQQECRNQCVQSCLEQQHPQQQCESDCEEMCRLPTPPPPQLQQTLQYQQPNLNTPPPRE